MHAARDDDLQGALDCTNVAKRAAHAGRNRDRIELLQHETVLALVVPGNFESSCQYGESLISRAVGVQARPLPWRADRDGHRHAAGPNDRCSAVDWGLRTALQTDDREQLARVDDVARPLRHGVVLLNRQWFQGAIARDALLHLLLRYRARLHGLGA